MDDENNNNTSSFTNSQSLALRLQKKIASKMSTKTVAKIFIDEPTGRILDNLYKLVKDYTKNKKQAETLLNDIIKIIIKIGLLYKNDQLTGDELRLCDSFRQSFHSFVKSALSFYEIEYTLDSKYLHDNLIDCKNLIQLIVKFHLTDKSKNKIENIFTFFSDQTFLESIFKNQSNSYKNYLKLIVEDTRKLVEEGSL
jgi:hypothetical protein